jgi:hypothetical protein
MVSLPAAQRLQTSIPIHVRMDKSNAIAAMVREGSLLRDIRLKESQFGADTYPS